MHPVRTRFAVSPTGFMHVGGLRNALFDWLLAEQAHGSFILRIEDTDQAREVPGAVAHIQRTLAWLGLEARETYTQSERLDIYKAWGQKLVDKGRAYVDTTSPETVQQWRDAAKAAKQPFLFRNHRPENPPAWDGKQTLRFKSDPKAYDWEDAVMGNLHAGAEAVDDFVLIKADGFPTYNFCHVVDDGLMNISHVVRSQEFIASMPRYLNLYEALEFPLPVFAHLPWIMADNGNKKLSKRDGAKDVLAYAEDGFLPETILNFLASLGWNDGTEQEIFSRAELVEKFSLSRVQHSGARFDEQRLLWMNGYWIRQLPFEDLYERTMNYWPASAKSYTEAYRKQVLGLIQERLKFFKEIPQLTNFFFEDLPLNPALISGNKQLSKLSKTELLDLLTQAQASLTESDFELSDLTDRLNKLLETTGQKPGILFSLIRIATTQAPFSPSLAETLAVLGKDTSLRRLAAQISAL